MIMMYREIERHIYVSERLFFKEHAYTYGSLRNDLVRFLYYNRKSDKETEINLKMNYCDALNFARKRANDGRYKNFDFIILDTHDG